MNGPQGIGVLYVRRRPGCGVEPLLHGGGQEGRLRPGTLPLALIAGLGAAAAVAAERQPDVLATLTRLGNRLWEGLRHIPGLRRNGSAGHHFPGILNVSLADLEGESLLLALDPLCVASGSACNAQSGEASAVLRSMGLTDLEAQAAIRLSPGVTTSDSDIDVAVRQFHSAVDHLRALTPLKHAG